MKTSRKYKPLPHQPRQAPANLNQPLDDRNASKRAKRHADNEAAREADQRLMARDDLDVRGRKIYTFRWLRNMDAVMRLWCEFFQTKLDSLNGPDYFKPGGPRPDRLLVHRFLFWIADTSVGNLYTSSHAPSTMTETVKVTTGTVERYMIVLASACGYFNQCLDADLVKSARLWIRNNLSQELSLNREIKEKPVAYTADVEHLIEAIWSFNSISVFKSVRAMFNTTLVLNSLVDGASRIGEFVPTDTDSKEKGRYLKWKDLQFFMLPSDGVDGITICIVVLCKWLKRQSYNAQGFKGFVVRLLPPHLAFQDSCRFLVVLALHHGYFRDFRTWDELLSSRPSSNGNPILLKPSCMERPVFLPLLCQLSQIEALDPSTEDTDEDGETVPWTYCQLQRIVQHLSRLAGFAQKTGLHQLRHGDAYLLAKHCKDRETARTLMGQQTDSAAFSKYISNTSTTDIQGLARSIASYDLTQFSGLSLGKCSNAPVTLPAEELAIIDSHPEFVDALKECDEAKDECIRQFGSLQRTRKAAQESTLASQLLHRYHILSLQKNGKWKRLAELRFRAFREEAVRELTAARPVKEPDVGVSETLDQSESSLSIMDDYRALDIEAEEDTGLEDFQPFLEDRIEDIGHLTTEQATSMIAAMPDDVVQEVLNQQLRKHNIFRRCLDSMVGSIGRQSTLMSSFSYDYVRLRDIYETVAKNEDITSSTVTALLLDLLSREHHMRDLPTHWISTSDASRCVVCEQKLSIDTGYTHVYKCLQIQAKAHSEKLWDEYRASLPTKCTWTSTVKSKACKVDLTNATPQERQKHFHKHNNSTGYKCYWDGCKVTFSSQEELCQHTYAAHRILLWKSSICLYFWCHYCNKNIFEIKSTPERLAHFASHYDEAIQAVRDYGYAGVYIGSSHAGHRPNEFLPAHCVFCLHNERLDAEDRLIAPRPQEIAPHMHTHFRYLASSDLIYCPASSAGGARHPLCQHEQGMTPTEAWKHIQDMHYGLEFGPQWGPGAPGKIRGKRKMEQHDDEGADIANFRTKVYEKKKPVVAPSGSVPGKKATKSAAPISQSSKTALALKERSANTRLTVDQSGTRQNRQMDYDLSVIDPMLQ
jgi:hypothetical protein